VQHELNNSTFLAVSRWLETTRLTILRLKTALYCFEHQRVEQVTHVFPNRTVALDCGCRRNLYNRSDDEIFNYEVEKMKRKDEPRILRYNPTDYGYMKPLKPRAA